MHEFPLEGVVDGWQWSSLSLSSARWRRSAGWFPGSMCVPPPSKSHPALPLALPLPFRSLGVVIQISKSVCPLTPRISFPRLSILLRLSSTSTSPAGSSSFHGNLEAGLCILYPVCDRSRLVMYAGPRMWISVSIYAYVCTRWGAFRRGRGNRVHVYVCGGGCEGIGRRCEQRQMRNCHLRQEGWKELGREEEGVCRFFVLCRVAAIPLPREWTHPSPASEAATSLA